MLKNYREHHILSIFAAHEERQAPLDLFLKHYFKAHKAIGAKDRKYIAETVYGITRWRGLLDYLSDKPSSWENRYLRFLDFSPQHYLTDETIPLHVRVSFPKKLFELLKEGLGEEKAILFCLASNESAPTTIRVNALKTERSSLFSAWHSLYDLSLCSFAKNGLVFPKRINLFGLPEFKMGYFEMQDEASQLIAELIAVSPGEQVLDFCAGSGGKALAIAPAMQQKGQLYLHDIRDSALTEAKKRLRRAGVQNAQVLSHDAPHKARLKHAMDWVLVDVPCSGSGTLRRNPDMKWKFDAEKLDLLLTSQRQIFEEACSFVKPGGKIVYATCSVLPQENALQVDYFEKA
ncbi:MAG TPA: RsmB/NOP family class I SAM-dependent RNA methyltransferase, partial [Rhabdochlamydiaceae bacterium]